MPWLDPLSCVCMTHRVRLLLRVLLNGKFASVVAALGAYVMVHDLCTAVAACGQLGALLRIVRSSLGRTGL